MMVTSHLLLFWLFLLVGAEYEFHEFQERKAENNNNKHSTQFLEREKRLFTKVDSDKWPKAIVPYVITPDEMGDKPELDKVMALYEDQSCLRFPYWNESTGDLYGIGHQGHMKFVSAGGCYTNIKGYSGSSSGSPISCCANIACIHEIGHILGFTHEQVSPLRNGWIRINTNNIWPSRRASYKMTHWSHLDLSKPYDLSTIMHYAAWMFNTNDGPVFTELFPELRHTERYYYFFMEIADGYKCRELPPCNGRELKCENDGYQTAIRGKCECKCPPGLDPENLCKTPLKKVKSTWPRGQYALPKPKTGCPNGGSFQDGQLTQFGPDGNSVSTPYHMLGEVKDTKADIHFCTRTVKDDNFGSEDAAKFNWPIGNHCIYMKGNKCPTSFTVWSIKYKTNNVNLVVTGQIPEGTYSQNVEINLCCQYRGFTRDPASFPTQKPFALFPLGSSCQQVTGMRVANEHFTITSTDKIIVDDGFKNRLSNHGKALTLPLCYYTPVYMDCGTAITLTKANPETTIEATGKGHTDMECTWIVRGDHEKGTLVLDFEEFSLKKDSKSCRDKVVVSHSRIGQKGLEYCGETMGYSIRSITNKLLVKFFTTGQSDSSFKARIKWIPDDDLCYDVGLRGVNYDGNVNYTRTFEPCLPWTQMTQCQHHPFLREDELDSLEGNACRNPDNSFRPWCYTDVNGCQRNYCDVCELEVPHDHLDDCDMLQYNGFCTDDASMAVKYCAATCFDKLPAKSTVRKHSDVHCNPPTPPSDGTVVGKVKSKYNLGDEVEYKCNRGARIVSSKCMTSGKWSEVGYACLECPIGFDLYNQTCYGLMDDAKEYSYNDAMKLCKDISGRVMVPESQDEAYFISKHAYYRNIWTGINDKKTEGTWLLEDGTTPKWSKWVSGKPKNNGDCTMMDYTTGLADVSCSSSYFVVCAVPKLTNIACEDFLGSVCESLLVDRATLCDDYPDFANRNCRKSCGVCQATSKTAKCSTKNTNSNVLTLSTSQSKISVGDSVTYGCEKYTYRHEGNEVRACLPNGKLTGKPLQCGDCPFGFKKANHNCHGFIKGEMLTRQNAREKCKSINGFVAMPKSEAENDAIAMVGLEDRMWIGARLSGGGNNVIWEDGSKGNWSYWAGGEPKTIKGGETCIVMNANRDWETAKCENLKLTTVCTIPKSGNHLCYDRTNKGVTYNGKINVTVDDETCGHWADKTKCNVNPFKAGFERFNLDRNYCRNPDGENTPWCYTNDCNWALCNVCDNGKDSSIKNYVDVQCGPPVIPSDGEMVDVKQSKYKLGVVVTFKCKKNKFVVTTTCLTSGDWSPVGLACTECPDGYRLYQDTCYGFVDKRVTHSEGQEECSKIGGHLTRPKSPEENAFIASLSHGKTYWTDAKRDRENGYKTMVWGDGTAVMWNNFLNGKPDRYICAYGSSSGRWDTTDCDFKAPNMRLMCAVSKQDSDICEDFLEKQCQELFSYKPTICRDFPEFVKTFCAKTCHVCVGTDKGCDVTLSSPNVIISSKTSRFIGINEHVSYDCVNDNFFAYKGDKVRVCGDDLRLRGTPLQCKKIIKVGSPTLTNGKITTPELIAFFGDNSLYRIAKKGEIVAWEFYSESPIKTSFQVWRKVKVGVYRLIGQNTMTTGNHKQQRYDVPAGQRIKVQPGDLIGIVNSNQGGVRFTACDGQAHPDWAAAFSWSKKLSSLSDFRVGDTYSVKSNPGCVQFSFRALVAVLE